MLFAISLSFFLQLSSKSDTEVKKPGPPVRPKPVRPKWKAPETKATKFQPVAFEPITDTTVKTEFQIPLAKPLLEQPDTKKTRLDYLVSKPKPWIPSEESKLDWQTQFETQISQTRAEVSMETPQPKFKVTPIVTKKTTKEIQIETKEPEKPKPGPKPKLKFETRKEFQVGQEPPEEDEYIITYEVPDDEMFQQETFQQRVARKSQETWSRQSSHTETKMVIMSATSDDSDVGYFTKPVHITKLPPPTPEKIIIGGDLYPEKPRKYKRVRVRKHKSRTVKYQPVPYVSKSSIFVVPDRTDVLMAAEAWAR